MAPALHGLPPVAKVPVGSTVPCPYEEAATSVDEVEPDHVDLHSISMIMEETSTMGINQSSSSEDQSPGGGCGVTEQCQRNDAVPETPPTAAPPSALFTSTAALPPSSESKSSTPATALPGPGHTPFLDHSGADSSPLRSQRSGNGGRQRSESDKLTLDARRRSVRGVNGEPARSPPALSGEPSGRVRGFVPGPASQATEPPLNPSQKSWVMEELQRYLAQVMALPDDVEVDDRLLRGLWSEGIGIASAAAQVKPARQHAAVDRRPMSWFDLEPHKIKPREHATPERAAAHAFAKTPTPVRLRTAARISRAHDERDDAYTMSEALQEDNVHLHETLRKITAERDSALAAAKAQHETTERYITDLQEELETANGRIRGLEDALAAAKVALKRESQDLRQAATSSLNHEERIALLEQEREYALNRCQREKGRADATEIAMQDQALQARDALKKLMRIGRAKFDSKNNKIRELQSWIAQYREQQRDDEAFLEETRKSNKELREEMQALQREVTRLRGQLG